MPDWRRILPDAGPPTACIFNWCDAGLQPELLVAAVPAGRGSGRGPTGAYPIGYGAFAFSVRGRQDLEALRAGGHQLQRSICGARIVSAVDETTAPDCERASRFLTGARHSAFRVTQCIESYARPTHKKQTLTTTTASGALKLRAEDPQSTSRTRSGRNDEGQSSADNLRQDQLLCISQVLPLCSWSEICPCHIDPRSRIGTSPSIFGARLAPLLFHPSDDPTPQAFFGRAFASVPK